MRVRYWWDTGGTRLGYGWDMTEMRTLAVPCGVAPLVGWLRGLLIYLSPSIGCDVATHSDGRFG